MSCAVERATFNRDLPAASSTRAPAIMSVPMAYSASPHIGPVRTSSAHRLSESSLDEVGRKRFLGRKKAARAS
jgi:hypothetical protein